MKRRGSERGFMLMEAMIAVFIFSIGVLALGKCVDNCIMAEQAKEEDEHARRFLANRMAEIEQGSLPLKDKATEEFKEGAFAGMTLRTTRVPLKKKNENNKELFGLFIITLELGWQSKGQDQLRELTFYVFPQQQR
jgi:type II secretory pathway component PulJ